MRFSYLTSVVDLRKILVGHRSAEIYSTCSLEMERKMHTRMLLFFSLIVPSENGGTIKTGS